MLKVEKFLNSLIVLAISAILLGAFSLQLFKDETPCPLCFLQRIGMIGVAIGALLNLRFAIRPSHYALALFSALSGGFVSLRQIALHICPGYPAFGYPFWGLSLYTWAAIVFLITILYVALLLFLFDRKKEEESPIYPMNGYILFIFIVFFIIVMANAVAVGMQCGLSPCTE